MALYQNDGDVKGIKDIIQGSQNKNRSRTTGSYKISRRVLNSCYPQFSSMSDKEIAQTLEAALKFYFASQPLENSEQRGYNGGEKAV